MFRGARIGLVAATLASWPLTVLDADAAGRPARVEREAYLCVSWAAWREYGLASLTARGARAGRSCPLRLARGTSVVVIDEDAGAGAAEIRYRGRNWFVDAQRLD